MREIVFVCGSQNCGLKIAELTKNDFSWRKKYIERKSGASIAFFDGIRDLKSFNLLIHPSNN